MKKLIALLIVLIIAIGTVTYIKQHYIMELSKCDEVNILMGNYNINKSCDDIKLYVHGDILEIKVDGGIVITNGDYKIVFYTD